MSEVIITKSWEGYIAVLEEYDGAPDAVGPESFVGHGDTAAAALVDLKEQLSDYAVDQEADRVDFLYEQMKDKRSGL
jgi:hypothetical protein